MRYNQRAIFVSEDGNPFSGLSQKTVISPPVTSDSEELNDDVFYSSVRKAQKAYDNTEDLRIWGYITEIQDVLNRREEIVNTVSDFEFVEDVSLFDAKYRSHLEVEFCEHPNPNQIDSVASVFGYSNASDARYETDENNLVIDIRWIQKYDEDKDENVVVSN